ncbi:thioredoxin-like protein [Lentinus tigrinus ALCF2SS1-7]|uniref:Thioredoxin-like protein n=1 Tax=Lentinus tigrinus ALCF2SS1-6 TaxID=1328759 RepID=A0A5C2S896_9APHY|nr:thioredoxin-like protein [Lentinus tigrinus ALCF2SS1-6]RPD74715.1 thioredoxin-like protein [Lentinus tigrinus ALCF2SS1-7]
MQPGVISLVVISDIVCPWCYIGQRELQKAIRDVTAEYDLKIKVEHRPYLLHPSMEETVTLDKRTWYLEKFGQEKVEQIQSMVESRAKEVGVEINFDGTVSQTIRAHRLSRKAFELGGQEMQEKYMDAIFHAYFTEGKNISDYEVLGELAEQAGIMSKEKTAEFLDSDEFQEEVEHNATDARKKGVTGVPFTIINGRWAVSGGQSSEVYAQIFRKLAGKGPLHPIPTAPSCGDGTCPAAAAAAAVKS